MNRYNPLSEEQKELIKEYYFVKGYGQDATARKVGVSRNSVRKVIREQPEEVWYQYWKGGKICS